MFVNPYSNPKRDEDTFQKLKAQKFPAIDDPTVFAVAGASYRNLVENGVSQSILITGESGAGKKKKKKKIILI